MKQNMQTYKINICKDGIIRIKNVLFNMKQKENYKIWIKNNEPNNQELEKQRKTKFEIQPKISIIVPMYNTPYRFFKELVECLIDQTYTNWELCLADGSTKQDKDIQTIIRLDNRIKYKFLNENKGISGNTNECIKMATGDFIALFDHDDLLPNFCLFEIVKAINENPNVEFIYTDEDKVSANSKRRFEPYFKPDFAIDTLRSGNYICHFSVFKKNIMDKLKGERGEYDGAQDFDLILRITEIVNPKNIIHIPKILYHWRISNVSTAKNEEAKPYAYMAGEKAVRDHLNRLGIYATVKKSNYYGMYNTIYSIKGSPKISILISNTDEVEALKRCINSILEKTTYGNYEIDIIENNSKDRKTFNYYRELQNNEKIKILYFSEKTKNYSKIINYGMKLTDGEYILQLSNKTEVINPEWLDIMLGICNRNDVGIVGAKILYPDTTIQHAGIVLGMTANRGYVHRGMRDTDYGYFSRNFMRQNVIAVSKDCMLTKREVFDEVEGLNENLSQYFNGIDFCLKARKKGYLIVYEPNVKLYINKNKKLQKETEYEKEKAIFEKIWDKEIKMGDPYYNINLRLDNENCEIRTDKEREKR